MNVRRILQGRKRFFLILFAVTIALVPVTTEGTEEPLAAFPENDTGGYQPVDIIAIDPAVKAATPHHMFLLLDNEGKKTRISDVSRAIDLLYPNETENEARKMEFTEKMLRIWDTYPVVSEFSRGESGFPTYGGFVVTLRFAPNLQNVRLTEEENAVIRESEALLKEAYLRQQQSGSLGLQQEDLESRPGTQSSGFGYVVLACAGTIAILLKSLRKNP